MLWSLVMMWIILWNWVSHYVDRMIGIVNHICFNVPGFVACYQEVSWFFLWSTILVRFILSFFSKPKKDHGIFKQFPRGSSVGLCGIPQPISNGPRVRTGMRSERVLVAGEMEEDGSVTWRGVDLGHEKFFWNDACYTKQKAFAKWSVWVKFADRPDVAAFYSWLICTDGTNPTPLAKVCHKHRL